MLFNHDPLIHFSWRLRFSQRTLLRQISALLLMAILTQAAAPALVDAATLETAAQIAANAAIGAPEQSAPAKTDLSAALPAPQSAPALPVLDYPWAVELYPYGPITVGQTISQSVDIYSGGEDSKASPYFWFKLKLPAGQHTPICAIASITGTMYTPINGSKTDKGFFQYSYGMTESFSGTYDCEVVDDGILTHYSGDLLQPEGDETNGKITEVFCQDGSVCSYTCQARFQADFDYSKDSVKFQAAFKKGARDMPTYHNFAASWMPCEYALPPERTQAPEGVCLDGAHQA